MPLHTILERSRQWQRQMTVPQFGLIAGGLLITIGTLVMVTPFCSKDTVGVWEAFFTVTSAVTVTGLSIINISDDLTPLGQGILASLILTGGLGLMVIINFLQNFVQKGSGLRDRLDKGRALDEFGVGGIGPAFYQILITAAFLITLGTLLLYSFGFTDISNRGERLWASLFHCISAYNNAGFSLWADNLIRYRCNAVVNLVIGVLIICGGIGWRVTSDLWANRSRLSIKRLSLHTRIVLFTTLIYVIFGGLGFLLAEMHNPRSIISDLDNKEQILVAMFQSVTTRTAGFSTIPLSQDLLSDPTLFLMMFMMFVGASPGGTGGGIKTTTFMILMSATYSTLKGQKDVVVFGRQLSDKILLKAIGVTVSSLLFVLLMAFILTFEVSYQSNVSNPDHISFLEKLFTCISAFGTVGLDIGVTSKLSPLGQSVLMFSMFVGRLGILLSLNVLMTSQQQSRIAYPREEIYV
ncbi:possible sodium transporter, Trk family protein (chromatophore) [Paulinella micropora]|uniref:Possible sodium transporter, Trk family protein n=1 Tax=Paulinella micropora TaxID=1928728 RepID=A0A1L5YCK4_9EUKA|nr:putative sodium transporter [Paulinella micropora]AQX45187.1 putative sodium transporter, Trk family protein [Paulinella micropora]BBL86404.1 possible sodium transporter, Trk family protein [Paulinella micropora]